MSVGFESILNSIYEVAQCPVMLIDAKGDAIFKKRPYGRVKLSVEQGLDQSKHSCPQTFLTNKDQSLVVAINNVNENIDYDNSISKKLLGISAGAVSTNSSDEYDKHCKQKKEADSNDKDILLNNPNSGNWSDECEINDIEHLNKTTTANKNLTASIKCKEDNANIDSNTSSINNATEDKLDANSESKTLPKTLGEEHLSYIIEELRKFSVPLHLTHRKHYGGYCLPDDSVLIIGPLEKNNSTFREYHLRITAVNALLDSFCFIAKRLVDSNQSVDTSLNHELADVLEELKEVKDITPDWLDVVMVEHPHHSYATELVKLDAVASGDPERYDAESEKGTDGINGTLAYTRFRDLQNLGICNVVLCSRAAISSGLSVEMAYTMADYIILTIERCRTEKEVTFVSHKAGLIFARMVRGLKKDESYKSSMSRLSRKALETIRRHLYLETDRKQIASQLKVNEDYLDRALKFDLNMTVSECLRVERVKEAKKLLISTETPIFEIAQMLMFNSSSHFARVFKRITGLAPNEYRDKKQNSNPYHL